MLLIIITKTIKPFIIDTCSILDLIFLLKFLVLNYFKGNPINNRYHKRLFCSFLKIIKTILNRISTNSIRLKKLIPINQLINLIRYFHLKLKLPKNNPSVPPIIEAKSKGVVFRFSFILV